MTTQQPKWIEKFRRRFPYKDTFANSHAFFEIIAFIEYLLTQQREQLIGEIEKIEEQLEIPGSFYWCLNTKGLLVQIKSLLKKNHDNK